MTDLITPWETVERAKAGDREAFAEIYRNCHTPILRFVYHRTGSQEIAEDITGEVWVRALRRIGGVEFLGRDIQAWLTTIARNLIADYFKSAHHRLSRPQDDLGNDVDRADESRFDKPGEELVLTEDVSHLFAAIQRLTPDQREVIKFRYLEELSVADTAAVMQREQGAIKALAFRGMSRLATDLKLREAVR